MDYVGQIQIKLKLISFTSFNVCPTIPNVIKIGRAKLDLRSANGQPDGQKAQKAQKAYRLKNHIRMKYITQQKATIYVQSAIVAY
jgi:hypothetical protein